MTVKSKQAHFYLVSMKTEEGNVWKWGITTQATAKKRNSAYFDTHRWVEIKHKGVGRRMEKLMGCLMLNVLNDRETRCMYHESVEESFPFDVLLEMIDWVIASVGDDGSWPAIGQELYKCACPGSVGYEDVAPAFALEFRAKMEAAQTAAKKARETRRTVQPMWA